MSRDHRKLKAFELADSLVLEIYASTRGFPKEELFVLVPQMRRAAISVAANIVEGSARDGHNEYCHFLSIALGSLRELGYFITLAHRLGYLQQEIAAQLTQHYDDTARTLSSLIRALKSG